MKIKTQEIKKNVLKSLKAKAEKAKPIEKKFEPENDEEDDEDESEMDSDEEVKLFRRSKIIKRALNFDLFESLF
jgi:hypothetical protein